MSIYTRRIHFDRFVHVFGSKFVPQFLAVIFVAYTVETGY